MLVINSFVQNTDEKNQVNRGTSQIMALGRVSSKQKVHISSKTQKDFNRQK